MLCKVAAAAAVSAVALSAAGCAAPSAVPGAAGRHPAASRPAATRPAGPRMLTQLQGEVVCDDLTAWLRRAERQDRPRFGPGMRSAQREAAGTQLGTGLAALSADLQAENSAALFAAPPGVPSDLDTLRAGCAAYGVIVRR